MKLKFKEMKKFSQLLLVFILIFISSNSLLAFSNDERFLECLDIYSNSSIPIHSPTSSSYTSILNSSIHNLKFISPTIPKPKFIITPMKESHVQIIVVCCRQYGLQIRIRSGGHDYEGMSYVSYVSFVLLDLIHLRMITVNIQDNTTWVQTGATIGELYYRIAEKSKILAFPAGFCPSVGAGGHISGAGYGVLMRKYGVAADHVIDARLVDVNGRILDKETMGEDLFWAIRGGGGASFGVILAWKIRLIHVPPKVTTFMVPRTLQQGASNLLYKWQFIAHKLHEDLFLDINIQAIKNLDDGNGNLKSILISFLGYYLGSSKKLLELMEQSFPEMGLKKEDCIEMSWIKSAVYLSIFSPETNLNILLERKNPIIEKRRFMAKSDYVQKPMSENVLEGIWKRFCEEIDEAEIIMHPYGGRMNEIEESAIAFPHRKGNIYKILYLVSWKEEEDERKHANWIRELYNYMTPYVSNSPRCSYLNFRDNDLGYIKNGNATYVEAKVWGNKYFKNNFDKLIKVKTRVDPHNFFTNEQGIPSLA